MNKRIKELAKQCTTWSEGSTGEFREIFDKEKFAELIVRECIAVNHSTCKTMSGLSEKEDDNTSYWLSEAIKEHFGVER